VHFFFTPHKQKNNYIFTSCNYEKAACDCDKLRTSSVYFALRQNIHSWSYFAISWTWLAELVTWQVWTGWLSQL